MATRTSESWEVGVHLFIPLIVRLWNKAAVYSSQRLATKHKAELDKAKEDLRKSQSYYNALRRQQRGGNVQSGTGQQGGGGRTSRRNEEWEKDAEFKKDREEVMYLSEIYETHVYNSKYHRYAESGTQQEAARMGLPAGRNISATPGRVPGSAASPRTTRATSTDEEEEEEDNVEGGLGRDLKVLDQGEAGGKGQL